MSLFIYIDSFERHFLRKQDNVHSHIMDTIATITKDDEFSFDHLSNLSHGHCVEAQNGRRKRETYNEVRKLLWSTKQIPFVAFLDLSRPSDKIIEEIENLRRWFPLAVFVLYCTTEEYSKCLAHVSSEWAVRLTRFFRFPKAESGDFGPALRRVLDIAGTTATEKVANAKFFSAFISYSHSDATFARWLYSALSAAGISCWLDKKELRAGDRIHSKIETAIKDTDKVLLCASKSSLTSWWVENELNSVIQKEQALWKETGKETLILIPLNLDDYMFSDDWNSGWKNQVVSRLAPDFSYWKEDVNDRAGYTAQPVIRALIIDTSAEKNRFSKLSK